MKNIKKLSSTYTYPAKGKGQPAIEVGFFTEVKKDRYGNTLRQINVLDPYGRIIKEDYCGQTLMISVETGKLTTSVRRAKREDLVKYKEAYESYLAELTIEEKKDHLSNIYSLLGEARSEADKEAEAKAKENERLKALEEAKAKEEAEKALNEANSEIEKLKAELAKSKEANKKPKDPRGTEANK